MIPVRDSTGADKYLQSKTNTSNEHITGHAVYLEKEDGTPSAATSTVNGAMAVGNAMKKFRDGFVTGSPDLTVWDQIWTNQADSFVSRGGDAAGSAYLKISMSPIQPNAEYELLSKKLFRLPSRLINGLSISQRIVGQEVELSLVGCNDSGVVEVGSTIADMPISGTVTIAANVATINFATPHPYHGGDRVLLKSNEVKQLNVGPVVVTVVSLFSISVPCTLANGTYNAGGFVEWIDQTKRANNAVGVLFENATATNGSWFVRRNGASIRSVNSGVNTTVANQSNTSPYTDAFNAASHLELQATMQEMLLIPRPADSVGASSASLKYTQSLPDEEKLYRIRIRVKNLSNLTTPVAKIVSIAKTGTTTATVTTDVPHNLTLSHLVQIYGVRDQVNFPNLTGQTAIASIISATQFTIIIGASVTASSSGGGVWEVEGSVLAPGVFAQVIQSISRTSNVLTVIGNGNWATPLPGETMHIYGCDATSMGLFDGAYKVLRVATTTLELESIGADFASINCGGAVIRRTDVRIHFIHELEYTRHVVELANQHGSGDASRMLPVSIPSGTAVTALPALAAGANLVGDASLQYRGGATGAASRFHLVAAAGTNATIVRNAAAKLIGWQVSNPTAAWRYVKLHNLATAPTAGAAVAQTIAVPPNDTVTYSCDGGIAFTVGIGITTTTGAADADTTGVTAGDLVIDLFWA